MTTRLSRALALAFLRRIRSGSLTVVENERRLTFGAGAPMATVRVRSPRAWRKLLRGSNGLAEAYAQGLWSSPDPTAVVRVAARNAFALDRLRRRLALLLAPAQRVRALTSRNTRARSRRDIAAHYDLGNELFELMLDPTMSYSCALFERPGMSLREASLAKLEHVCRKLDLGPEDHLLEIGSGWGALALHAAGVHGARVTTTTISREQHAYTSEQVRRAGMQDRVTVLREDYRDVRGVYDKLVSIEMIEAVGWRHFDSFFERCSELLAPDGAMLLQAITIDEQAYDVEKASQKLHEHLHLPERLPAVDRGDRRRRGAPNRHDDRSSRGHHQPLRSARCAAGARTSSATSTELAALGYDERFRRIWTLYLAYCEAGFAERRIRDVQVVLAKPGWHTKATMPSSAERMLTGVGVAG